MRKVLIIATDFPPKLSIASRRPFGLAKYLPRYGWEPIVLTESEKERNEKHHPNIKVIEAKVLSIPTYIKSFLDIIHERKNILKNDGREKAEQNSFTQGSSENRLITLLRNIIFYPDRYLTTWYRNALKKYYQTVGDNHIDAIISTARPFTTHLIARHLKVRENIPWIADFRDLWPHWKIYENDADYYNLKNCPNRLLLKWSLGLADALVTVNKPSSLLLKKRFKKKRIYNIPNGFDPEEYSNDIEMDSNSFILTYTGHIREDRQDPEILLKVVSKLIKEGSINKKQIIIRFYGKITPKLTRDIRKHHLDNIVLADGFLKPRDEIIIRQKESSLLILLAARDAHNRGHTPGKIYEYFAARRPILTIGKPEGPDVLEDLLNMTRTGNYARTIEEVNHSIMTYYDQFINKGKVEYEGIDNEIKKFSYEEMALKYAKILDMLTKE